MGRYPGRFRHRLCLSSTFHKNNTSTCTVLRTVTEYFDKALIVAWLAPALHSPKYNRANAQLLEWVNGYSCAAA